MGDSGTRCSAASITTSHVRGPARAQDLVAHVPDGQAVHRLASGRLAGSRPGRCRRDGAGLRFSGGQGDRVAVVRDLERVATTASAEPIPAEGQD